MGTKEEALFSSCEVAQALAATSSRGFKSWLCLSLLFDSGKSWPLRALVFPSLQDRSGTRSEFPNVGHLPGTSLMSPVSRSLLYT